jgi:hypothetical protein
VTYTHTFAIIDEKTYDTIKQHTIRVERKPSETNAYYIPYGHYKVMTSNGESKCVGPVWILWDTSGYPYPITPDEFNKLYTRKNQE